MPRPEVVLHAVDPASPLVRAILAGCEEEGVPCGVHAGDGNADDLARAAASRSELFVGIGVDRSGGVAIHDQRLPRSPLIAAAAVDRPGARVLGGDAARLVKGLPLRMAADGMLSNHGA